MESLGYIVTNKFIILAVDSKLEFAYGENDETTKIHFENVRKVHKISNTTTISILGSPFKITDLYKYILGLKNSDKSFDTIIEDLESIFNYNLKDFVEKVEQVKKVIPKYQDENGVLDQEKLLKHFEKNDALLLIAKDLIELINSSTFTGAQIFLFTNENGQNYFGKYISFGANISGKKSPLLKNNNFYFGLESSIIDPKVIEKLKEEKISELKSEIDEDWELSDELIMKFKIKVKQILKEALTKLSPFNSRPNIIFYELSDETKNIFIEPDLKLNNINFNRK